MFFQCYNVIVSEYYSLVIFEYYNVIISERYRLVILEYYNARISEHYSLGIFTYYTNILSFVALNAHSSAPRAAPELTSKLIISEFDAQSFDNDENICFISILSGWE